jgi:hypothetical protein
LIFSQLGASHEQDAYRTDNFGTIIGLQVQRTLESFTYTGETSMQYEHRAPLLDFWTGALFVLGVGVFGWRLRNPSYFLLAIWLWLTLLLGSILTTDAPFSPHLVGMLALLAIFPALFIDLVWRLLERAAGTAGRFGAVIAVGALVSVAAFANVRDYVQVHTVLLQPADEFTVLSYYMLQVQDQYQVYFISRHDSSLDYDTVNFLAPGNEGISLRDGPIVLQPRPPDKGMIFIIDPGLSDWQQRLEQLEQMFPLGREEQHFSTNNGLLFITYVVDS